MLLNEFFGAFDPLGQKKEDKKEKKYEESELSEAIFEFILNHDRLHKEQFLPIAQKISRHPTTNHNAHIWLPLVNKGCMEFYHHHKMKEDATKLFHEEFRKKMCEKISSACNKDILKGSFELGK